MKKPKLSKRDFDLINLALDICGCDYAIDYDYKGNVIKGPINDRNIRMQKQIEKLTKKLAEIQDEK